jgi:hypothetical protein
MHRSQGPLSNELLLKSRHRIARLRRREFRELLTRSGNNLGVRPL